MALVYRRQITRDAVGIQVGLKLLRRLEGNRFTVMFNAVLTVLDDSVGLAGGNGWVNFDWGQDQLP
ncbi:hypothetical protein [Hydrocarboniclastica marina]|uniref:Uncharacterized protein n=1 Tax=Hydrocarboniclastica marina TaxID=2259620 RepID=A0A4P7XCM6_9ALTE|nr:hypothetical protein [Hydrocarboniclastica marina]QCF24598.1 hypothetical protein soil367_00740 [Hydrocarboniclastica marina]